MTADRIVCAAAAALVSVVASAAAFGQGARTCEVAAFRGMTQPGGASTTMRVANTGEACRITYWMRTDPQRVPFETAEVTRAPSNGTATATGNGVAYTPRPGFTGSDTFTVVTRGVWQGTAVNGQVVVNVTVLPRP